MFIMTNINPSIYFYFYYYYFIVIGLMLIFKTKFQNELSLINYYIIFYFPNKYTGFTKM